METLGRALHYLQGVNVPYHAKNKNSGPHPGKNNNPLDKQGIDLLS